MKRSVVLTAALLSSVLLPLAAALLPGPHLSVAHAAPVVNSASFPGSVLVFPKFLTGTVNVGTTLTPVPAPRTAFEISVTCPGSQRCAEFERVRLLARWVCPGPQDGPTKYVCDDVDFDLFTTVKGTLWFSPEPGLDTALSPLPGTASNPTPAVRRPRCAAGYLVVYVVNPEDQNTNNPRGISFNGLIGNAVIRETDGPSSAYTAIPIQSPQPINTILDPRRNRTLVFDGVTYARVPGRVFATLRLDRDLASASEPAIDTFLTLLTLDVDSNRENLPTFVDLDFFNEVETVRSTSVEFICWMARSLSRGAQGSFVNRNLKETAFPGAQVLLESGAARKAQFAELADPTCALPLGCPVTLLGLIETKERSAVRVRVPGVPDSLVDGPYVRAFSYGLFNDGLGVDGEFRPHRPR